MATYRSFRDVRKQRKATRVHAKNGITLLPCIYMYESTKTFSTIKIFKFSL